MTAPSTRFRRMHFIGLLALVFKSLKQHKKHRNILYLQFFFYFLPATIFWLSLSSLASKAFQGLSAQLPKSINLLDFIFQQQSFFLATIAGIFITSVTSSLGFLVSSIKNYQTTRDLEPFNSRPPRQALPAPSWLRILVKTFLASLLLFLSLGIIQALMISTLPAPLSMVGPLLAIYVFACATLLPVLYYSSPHTLLEGIRSCLTLSFVDRSQSKMSCAFSLLNSAILFYFLIMLGDFLKDEISLRLGAEILVTMARPLPWLGIKLSQFAFLGNIVEALILSFAMWLLASCIATIYYWSQFPSGPAARDGVSAPSLQE